LKRANGCCEGCGTAAQLELHHLTYTYWAGMVGDYSKALDIFGHETADDLEALCRSCHLSAHQGPFDEFYADPEEAEAERDYYEHIAGKDD
jgi:hypothetical protein